MQPIPAHEYTITTMRSSGPGGQHANKVETGVELRFDIGASSLRDEVKERMLKSRDKRITNDGVLILRSTRYRSQLKNREAVIDRLNALITRMRTPPRKRKPTKPPKSADKKRLEHKRQRSEKKQLRRDVPPPD